MSSTLRLASFSILLATLIGCGSLAKDIRTICDAPDKSGFMDESAEMKQMKLAQYIEANITTSEAKTAMEALSLAPSEHKLKMFQAVRQQAGDTGPCAFEGMLLETSKMEAEQRAAELAAKVAASKPKPESGAIPVIGTGSLSKEAIKAGLAKVQKSVRYCYQKSLAKNPSLAGKVVVSFVIGPDGNVMSADAKESFDEAVGSCVVEKVKKATFDEPIGGGVVKVNYPFVFSPG